MAVTILAAAFLVVLGALAVAGFRMFRSEAARKSPGDGEKCSICGRRFEKSLLLERQIGDYRLLRFCRECVLNLYSDFGLKN